MAFEIHFTPQGSTVEQVIDFDCETSVSYNSPSMITDHVVEKGADMTDHVRPGNDTFTVEAIATNTPIVMMKFGMDGATMEARKTDLADGKSSAVVFSSSQRFDRVFAIDKQVLALRDTAQVLTVVTRGRTVENCVIAEYRRTVDVDKANILALSIDFRVIRIATTQTTTAPIPAMRAGQGQINRGHQPVRPATTEENAAVRQSGLYRIFF
jgi:hypothetical protein